MSEIKKLENHELYTECKKRLSCLSKKDLIYFQELLERFSDSAHPYHTGREKNE